MMLTLLLTELTRLDVHLLAEFDGLHVKAPAGVLTDELRQAMQEHKAALLRYALYPYVETIDGLGTLTGARREQDAIFSRSRHWERLRYKIGVKLLLDGVERFYLPGTVREVPGNDHQAIEQPSREVLS